MHSTFLVVNEHGAFAEINIAGGPNDGETHLFSLIPFLLQKTEGPEALENDYLYQGKVDISSLGP